MTKRESIVAVLVAHEIDPDQVVTTDSGPRTAYDVMEAHVMAGMDEIEEGTKTAAENDFTVEGPTQENRIGPVTACDSD